MTLFDEEEYRISLQDAVLQIKVLIENAIVKGDVDKKGKRIDGCSAKNNLIKSQIPIILIHDAVKTALINNGVNPDYILPLIGEHKGELKVFGQLKAKNQDVCVLPNDIKPSPEILQSDGLLNGVQDNLGRDFTERVLSINVRSQLSSITKNFDTLYERTFAEPLNLHLRCPKMVLGEVYMIPAYSYKDDEAKKNNVGFELNTHIEDFIAAFTAINNRPATDKDDYKYERACLVIADFSKKNPVIYDNDQDLIKAGLVSRSFKYSITPLSFPTFVSDLLDIYSQRFGAGKFI